MFMRNLGILTADLLTLTAGLAVAAPFFLALATPFVGGL